MGESLSRRALFAGAVGAVLGVVARALPGAAAEGDAVLLGKTNVMGDDPTILQRPEYPSAPALSVTRGYGSVDLGGSTGMVIKGFGATAIDATGGTRLRGDLDVDGTAEAKRVRLVAFAPTHPQHGTKGDLIVDRSGRLWFCTATGQSWKRLA
jgi:hypothetical protein